MAISFDEIMAFYKPNAAVYEEIQRHLGQVMPFIGAGFSVPIYGTWADALRALALNIEDVDARTDIERTIGHGDYLKAADMVEAARGSFNMEHDLVRYFSLQKAIDRWDSIESGASWLFPELFSRPILTTNFDEVLEEIYRRHDAPLHVLDPTSKQLAKQATLFMGTACLFKLHGTISGEMIDYGSIVFTSEQYKRHYQSKGKARKALRRFAVHRSILFLGCSMSKDRTMDVLCEAAGPGVTHYAIIPCKRALLDARANELGQRMHVRAILYPENMHDSVYAILRGLLDGRHPKKRVLRDAGVDYVDDGPSNISDYDMKSSNRLEIVSKMKPPDMIRPLLDNGQNWVTSVCFSPDGCQIACGFDDGTVRLWDVETGDLALPPLRGHRDLIRSVCFSPDGDLVASGSGDGTVCLWNAVTGQLVDTVYKGRQREVTSVCFSPKGNLLACASSPDCFIRLWGVAIEESNNSLRWEKKALPWRIPGVVTCISFSPDGLLLASGSSENAIRIWGTAKGEAVMAPLQGHGGCVRSVCFSPNGSLVASGSDDGTVRLWDAATGEAAMAPLQGHGGCVRSVCFSLDDSLLASGSDDGAVRLWDATTGKMAAPALRIGGSSVCSISFSPDGNYIACGSSDGIVRLLKVSSTSA